MGDVMGKKKTFLLDTNVILHYYRGENVTTHELVEALLFRNMREMIQDRMKEMNMSQTALAEIVGVHQPQVSMFLSGKAGLSVETMVAVCHTLGIKLSASIAPEKASKKKAKKKAKS